MTTGKYIKKNKKNISKKTGNKRSTCLTVVISLFKMILLSHWYDLSNVGTEKNW
ncbi:MAG: hypothetical protein ACMUEL_03020 [Flavobacteriales bacterium Tduv]